MNVSDSASARASSHRRQARRGRVVWPRAALVATALAVVAVAPAAARQADSADSAAVPEIEAVRFNGAHSLDPLLLRQAIVTQPTQCRGVLTAPFCLIGGWGWAEREQFLSDTAQVVEDAERLKTLYEVWGFPAATVAGSVERRGEDGVVVTFDIDEGEPIRIASIELRDTAGFDPPLDLPRRLPLAPGDPYALPRLQATEQLIQAALAERGRPYARVEVSGDVDEAAHSASLVLRVDAGAPAVFGSTRVEAQSPITEDAVLRRLAYRPGDPFRPSRMERSERSLYELPIVARAAVDPIGLLRGETAVETRVIVEPRKRTALQGEGSLSSTDCLQLGGQWRDRWFLGGPRAFSVGASFSNLFASAAGGGFPCGSTGSGAFAELDHAFQLELWQPSLFGNPDNMLRLTAFQRRLSSPNAFIERGFGGSIAVSRDLGHGLVVTPGLRLERNELEASGIYFCGNYGVCTAGGIDRLAAPSWLVPLQLIGVWTSSTTAMDVRRPETRPGQPWVVDQVPDWRFSARLSLEAAGAATGSDFGFTRALGEVTAMRVFGRTLELAARARLGGLNGDALVPPQLRLYSGGVNTVRGFGQNLLGPKVLVAGANADPAELCAPAPACGPGSVVDPDRVVVRPTGADRVFESNLEARAWLTDKVQLAAFLDYGRVWRRGGSGTALSESAVSALTPGAGIRVITDIGPIRIDVGYDGSGVRSYPLLADDGAGGVRVLGDVRYDPYTFDHPSSFREFIRRLQFHMAVGQPF